MSRVPVEAAGGWHRRAVSAALRALGIRLGPIQYLILCGGILIAAIGAGTVLAALRRVFISTILLKTPCPE